MLKVIKATTKAIGSGLIIGSLILVFIPSLRPQFSLNIKDWLLTHNAPVSFATAIKRSAPAVVNIYSSTQHLTPQNQIAHRDKGLGSGVIMSQRGFIITNLHVIQGADIIMVALQDGRTMQASVVGADLFTDLAVLHIALDDLPVMPFDLEQTTQVGDLVLAIGNPYNLGQTITQGIISATDRHAGLNKRSFLNLLQTDAAINDGNSGGALINSRGDLIGINNASFNSTSDYNSSGISFSIPINLVYTIMTEILIEGRVSRGALGFTGNPLSRIQEMSLKLQGGGVRVSSVVNNSTAYHAGLLANDVIFAANEIPFNSFSELRQVIAATKPGNEISLTVIRDGKQILMTMITSELTL